MTHGLAARRGLAVVERRPGIERMLWAGNSIDKARAVFREAVKHRPRGRYTVRQRSLVLEKWPL
jgi:hypothetical protein